MTTKRANTSLEPILQSPHYKILVLILLAAAYAFNTIDRKAVLALATQEGLIVILIFFLWGAAHFLLSAIRLPQAISLVPADRGLIPAVDIEAELGEIA